MEKKKKIKPPGDKVTRRKGKGKKKKEKKKKKKKKRIGGTDHQKLKRILFKVFKRGKRDST